MDLTSQALSGRLDVRVTDEVRLSVRAAGWEEDRGSGLGNNRANASGHSLSATLARSLSEGQGGWRLQPDHQQSLQQLRCRRGRPEQRDACQ